MFLGEVNGDLVSSSKIHFNKNFISLQSCFYVLHVQILVKAYLTSSVARDPTLNQLELIYIPIVQYRRGRLNMTLKTSTHTPFSPFFRPLKWYPGSYKEMSSVLADQ
jgi:hypothetical protein